MFFTESGDCLGCAARGNDEIVALQRFVDRYRDLQVVGGYGLCAVRGD